MSTTKIAKIRSWAVLGAMLLVAGMNWVKDLSWAQARSLVGWLAFRSNNIWCWVNLNVDEAEHERKLGYLQGSA